MFRILQNTEFEIEQQTIEISEKRKIYIKDELLEKMNRPFFTREILEKDDILYAYYAYSWLLPDRGSGWAKNDRWPFHPSTKWKNYEEDPPTEMWSKKLERACPPGLEFNANWHESFESVKDMGESVCSSYYAIPRDIWKETKHYTHEELKSFECVEIHIKNAFRKKIGCLHAEKLEKERKEKLTIRWCSKCSRELCLYYDSSVKMKCNRFVVNMDGEYSDFCQLHHQDKEKKVEETPLFSFGSIKALPPSSIWNKIKKSPIKKKKMQIRKIIPLNKILVSPPPTAALPQMEKKKILLIKKIVKKE
jgi:hypothetical protein